MTKYEYTAGNHADDHEEDARMPFPERIRLMIERGHLDFEDIPDDLAKDYTSDTSVCDYTWPMEFRIYKDGKLAGRYEVAMEMEPYFYSETLEEVGE